MDKINNEIDDFLSNEPKQQKELNIEPKIEKRLWPLTQDEYEGLEKSILKEGLREPIIVWKDYNCIIDGHNRYYICRKHNIPYKVVYEEYDNLEDILIWVDKNQFNRRNLNDKQRDILLGRISREYKMPRGDAETARKRAIGQHGLSPIPQQDIADEMRVGLNTLKRAEKFLNAIEDIERTTDKETADKIITGELNIPKKDILKIGEMDPFKQEETIKLVKEGKKPFIKPKPEKKEKNQEDAFKDLYIKIRNLKTHIPLIENYILYDQVDDTKLLMISFKLYDGMLNKHELNYYKMFDEMLKLKGGLNYRGFFVLQFENTSFEDGKVYLVDQPLDEYGFKERSEVKSWISFKAKMLNKLK